MIILRVVDKVAVVLVGASYISRLVTVSDLEVPYAIVIWASPALKAVIGDNPFPMLYE